MLQQRIDFRQKELRDHCLVLPLLCIQSTAARITIEVQQRGASGLLQLAANCSNPATATFAVGRLPAIMRPDAVRKLLVTAALRQHVVAVGEISGQPAIHQHIDVATLEIVLLLMLKARYAWATTWDTLLGIEPAASQLSSDTVAHLLLAAVQRRANALAMQLCRLPAAQQMDSRAVRQLLLAAVQQQQASYVTMLCRLPAAQQLGNQTTAQLLLAALEQHNEPCLVALCRELSR